MRTLANIVGKTLRTLPVTSAMDTTDILGGFEQVSFLLVLILRGFNQLFRHISYRHFGDGFIGIEIATISIWKKKSIIKFYKSRLFRANLRFISNAVINTSTRKLSRLNCGASGGEFIF